MTIKEFKVGQTAYIIGDGRHERNRFLTTEVEVAKVGRKYVTISGRWEEKFRDTADGVPYLVEQTELGMPRMLFPSSESVAEYIEREELKRWVQREAGWDKLHRYTLEQLRAVKRILEGGE